MRLAAILVFVPLVLGASGADAAGVDAPALYATHCGECHGPDRLGRMGPALLPQNLGRLRKEDAAATIRDGRPAVQMRPFRDLLNEAEIAALVDFVFTPLAEMPAWGMAEMAASRVVHTRPEDLPEKPVHAADPLNLFTVVESGDHHVTILDGDRFEPLWRFQSRFALHGGAKYSPDGRWVYLASRDGWVSKYDLFGLKPVAEIRAGINTRNIAVSSDGKWVAVGNTLPHSAVILDARDLSPVKVLPVEDGKGGSSRVSALYNAPPRQSFVVALKDFKEIREIGYGPGGGEGGFAERRLGLGIFLDDFFFDPPYHRVIGASRDGKGAVFDLGNGAKVADLALGGMPHLGSGISWRRDGRLVMATPHLKESAISVLDLETFEVLARIETRGPGFFLRSHENTPHVWADVSLGAERDKIHIIDKRSLAIVRTLTPEPGRTAAHVEFTRDGRFALVSIWEMDGALVVYDSATLEPVKRLPMVKPSGKYNVWNKISYAEGTSH